MTPEAGSTPPPFERLRRRVSHLPPLSPSARMLLLVLGWLLILLGIAGLVLPGIQGILTLILGAAVLSLVSPRMLAALRWLFRPWPRGWRRLLRRRRRIHDWFQRRFRRADDGDDGGDNDEDTAG